MDGPLETAAARWCRPRMFVSSFSSLRCALIERFVFSLRSKQEKAKKTAAAHGQQNPLVLENQFASYDAPRTSWNKVKSKKCCPPSSWCSFSCLPFPLNCWLHITVTFFGWLHISNTIYGQGNETLVDGDVCSADHCFLSLCIVSSSLLVANFYGLLGHLASCNVMWATFTATTTTSTITDTIGDH